MSYIPQDDIPTQYNTGTSPAHEVNCYIVEHLLHLGQHFPLWPLTHELLLSISSHKFLTMEHSCNHRRPPRYSRRSCRITKRNVGSARYA